jgi:hypothetical protein
MGDQKFIISSSFVLWNIGPVFISSLAPTNPHWASMVGYGPFSLGVIHKEGLCPRSGDINRLMMMKHELPAYNPGGGLSVKRRGSFNYATIGIPVFDSRIRSGIRSISRELYTCWILPGPG